MGSLNLANRLSNIPTPATTFNNLFGQSTVNVVRLKLCDIIFFEEQKTRLNSEEELEALAESIKEKGVLEPILVRRLAKTNQQPYEQYQVLNGRNRTTASRLANMEDIPAIIMEVTDDEARYIVAATTLNQRQKLLPSEKAFACRMYLEANSQMKQNDGQVQPLHRVDSLSEIASITKASRRTIAYYIRITYLIPKLLTRLDTQQLLFRPAVILSYLSPSEQQAVETFLSGTDKKISMEDAERLKEYHDSIGEVTETVITRLFRANNAPRNPPKQALKFSPKDTAQIFNLIPSEIQQNKSQSANYVIRALQYYSQMVEGNK